MQPTRCFAWLALMCTPLHAAWFRGNTPGEEITSDFGQSHVHVNALNAQRMAAPQTGSTAIEGLKRSLDAAREAGAIAQINHPSFFWTLTADDLAASKGAKLVKIFNANQPMLYAAAAQPEPTPQVQQPRPAPVTTAPAPAPPVVPQGPVRAWPSSINLRTWDEGQADPVPQFPALSAGKPWFPYPIRAAFGKQSHEQRWRTLNLENEYLACIVLPDLGGRLYSCRDKLSGAEMFHANPSVKKSMIGLRGAWVAMGVELNFPVGHSLVNVERVQIVQHARLRRTIAVAEAVHRIAALTCEHQQQALIVEKRRPHPTAGGLQIPLDVFERGAGGRWRHDARGG
jgi:hypothetical protein